MDFVIATSEGVVSIDNQPLGVDTTSLPTNVAIVAYDCSTGAGSIEYNDRLRILEPLLDPTPYQAVLNNWLVVAAALLSMPITLVQAQRVKIGIVNGIFNGKRQLPVTAIGHTWDASDISYADMQAAIASSTPGMIDSVATQADLIGRGAFASQTVPAQTSPAAVTAPTETKTYVTGGSQATGIPYTVTLTTSSSTYVTSVSASGGNITVQPQYAIGNNAHVQSPTGSYSSSFPAVGETTPITLTVEQIGHILSTIQSRRSALQNTRLSKTNAINGLTTVAAVITYDATTGWPS